MTGDRGDIVLGWLTRLVVVIGVLGVVLFDGVGLVTAHVRAADAASAAARAAARAYRDAPDVQQAYDAAHAEVLDDVDSVGTTDFRVAPDGSVTLSVVVEAPTALLKRIGPLRRFTTVTATGEAGRPSS